MAQGVAWRSKRGQEGESRREQGEEAGGGHVCRFSVGATGEQKTEGHDEPRLSLRVQRG